MTEGLQKRHPQKCNSALRARRFYRKHDGKVNSEIYNAVVALIPQIKALPNIKLAFIAFVVLSG